VRREARTAEIAATPNEEDDDYFLRQVEAKALRRHAAAQTEPMCSSAVAGNDGDAVMNTPGEKADQLTASVPLDTTEPTPSGVGQPALGSSRNESTPIIKPNDPRKRSSPAELAGAVASPTKDSAKGSDVAKAATPRTLFVNVLLPPAKSLGFRQTLRPLLLNPLDRHPTRYQRRCPWPTEESLLQVLDGVAFRPRIHLTAPLPRPCRPLAFDLPQRRSRRRRTARPQRRVPWRRSRGVNSRRLSFLIPALVPLILRARRALAKLRRRR